MDRHKEQAALAEVAQELDLARSAAQRDQQTVLEIQAQLETARQRGSANAPDFGRRGKL